MGTADMAFMLGDRVTEWRYIRDTAFLYDAINDVFVEALPPSILDPGTIFHVARIAQIEMRGHKKNIPRMDPQFQTHLNSGPHDGPVKGSPLWQAFCMIFNAESFDTRDRVYGILALPGLPILDIVPVYSKSVAQVFTEFTIATINSSYRHPFEIFCLIDGSENGFDLPSWVPNLASERHTGMIEGTFRAGDKWTRFQAMGFEDIDSAPALDFVNGNLQVCGCVIDVVDGLGGISKLDVDAKDPHCFSEPCPASRTPPWPLDISPASSIWKCLVAGTDKNGIRAPKEYSKLLDGLASECDYADWFVRDEPALHFIVANAGLLVDDQPLSSYFKHWPLNLDGWSQEREDWECARGQTTAARQTMMSRVKNKRLMVTGKGMLGLVPNSVDVGDVILIVRGHGRPLVASKVNVENESSMFRVKGEAYVDGMMEGEMMEDEHDKIWQSITFA